MRATYHEALSAVSSDLVQMTELVREAALDGLRDELPHSVAVVVEEMGLREGRSEDRPLLDRHANYKIEIHSGHAPYQDVTD